MISLLHKKVSMRFFMFAVLVAATILFSTSRDVFAGLSGRINKGNEAYIKENYDEALTLYNDAQLEDPESSEVFYNMGNVFYRQKKYKEAIDVYQKSMEKADVSLEAKNLYNIGNSLFNQGQGEDRNMVVSNAH